ncbi:MAG: asparagine synthase (glutamine-hydrolyzing), partial [Candidatus Dormibacteraceae bacterium]
MRLIRHRGPDDTGELVHLGPPMSVSLGHTRLAINDVSSAGHQPMVSDDGTVAMVFNGEIYNYPELRQECEARGRHFRSNMDGEVILHLWAMEGISCLTRLNGIFAIAIADFRSNVTTLARDPLGVKPLFYSTTSRGELFFASELAALKSLAGDLGGFDVAALAQFLTFLWIPDPRTPYRKGHSVEPGTAIQWEHGKLTERRYRSPLAPHPSPVRDVRLAIEDGAARLDAAVKRQLLSDVPIGLMASGGIDSGLLWSAADSRLTHAFCIEWSSDAAGLGEDASAVRRCQELFGTPLTMLTGETWDDRRTPSSGDLIADPAYELTRSIAAAARAEGCKVLLSGQGGDELLGGYRRHQVAKLLSRLRLPHRVSALAANAIAPIASRSSGAEYAARLFAALGRSSPLQRYLQLCSYSTPDQRARVLGTTLGEVDDEVVFARHTEVFESLPPGSSFLRKVMTVDLRVYLPGLGLAYADRAAMAEGVEVRVPLLDLDFVDWCLSLPDDMLIRGRTTKWIGKQ